MTNISSLDEKRPHVILSGDEHIHIVPILLLNRIVNSEVSVTTLDHWEEIVRLIIQDWLETNLE